MPFSIERKTAIGEMTRTETSAKDRRAFFLFVCYRKMWACCAQKKVKVEFVTTGKTLCFCDVDTKSKKKDARDIIEYVHAHM